MDKIILHSDLNNFFASVECILFPELKNIPIAVCGDPDKRHGIVLAKNQIAKNFGVKTATTILQAKKLCPELKIVRPHYEKYLEYSRAVKNIYYNYTDRVEPFGLDECWLDVTNSTKLFGTGYEIAQKISNDIKQKTALTVSIGVSFSKTFAKLASDMKKPDAITEASKDNYKNIIWNLPIKEMMYVGAATLKTLNKINIKTISDLANANDEILKYNLGMNGEKLKLAALGNDNEQVHEYTRKNIPKSIGHGTTTSQDICDNSTAKTVIYSLADMVAARLRKYNINANGVALSIKDNALNYFSRQKALISSTQTASEIAKECYELFLENYNFENMLPVRALTVSTYNLTKDKSATQISFFNEQENKKNKIEYLEKTIDSIHKKYGASSITRAAFLKNSFVQDSYEGDDELLPFYRQ